MRLSAQSQSFPEVFAGFDSNTRHLRIIGKKVFDEMQPKLFDGFHRILPRKNVHRVLHSVRGQNFLIVALRMRCLEIAVKPDANAKLFNVVATPLLYHAKQPNARLAIVVCAELYGHPSAPAISGISEWT